MAGGGARGPRTVLLLHSSAGLYGADVQLLAIVRRLDPGRWRAVCVVPERGRLAPLLEQAGAEVVVHPLAVLRRSLAGPAGAVALGRALGRDVRRLAPLARDRGVSLVHDNTSVVLSGGAVARRAKAAHTIHVREIYASAGGRAAQGLWPLMRRRLLAADGLACISEAVAGQFGGSPKARLVRDGLVRAPHPGGRAPARATLGLDPEAFTVALVGRISDWKGQDVLARALAEPALAEIAALGVVAGDAVAGTNEEQRLDALAAQLGVAGRLRRLGFRDDVDVVLGAADVLVVPSTRPEPLGLVALEAAAAGLPVVASAHGGITEAVIDGETGTLVAPGDPRALAVALRALADEPRRRTQMGRRGQAVVAERFDADWMVLELEQLWERALRGR
ncbi:MAG: glycosyltransferase family 4 protein [Thermoleophilaceae bacterium]